MAGQSNFSNARDWTWLGELELEGHRASLGNRPIRLSGGEVIPVLYEGRAVLAIDKPAGWLLAPASWHRTRRNLQAALEAGLAARDFWAASRNLRYLRFVHRLDAETSGVLLLAKSRGVLRAYGKLFQSRRMEKVYLAVVRGRPPFAEWTCRLAVEPDPLMAGRMRLAARGGKPAETHFQVLAVREDPRRGNLALLAVRPLTGRTHQIRLHLAASGYPVLGDALYGPRLGEEAPPSGGQFIGPSACRTNGVGRSPAGGKPSDVPRKPERDWGRQEAASSEGLALALRAVQLRYNDPFERHQVCIRAPAMAWLEAWGWQGCQSGA